jgi:hypothetical protein
MNPASVACFLGLFIGCVKPLKNLLYGSEAPLGMLVSILNGLGGTAVTGLLLVLGASMYHSRNSITKQRLKRLAPSILAASFIRLVFLPYCGALFVMLMMKYALLPDDPIMIFVILVEFCPPTNILIAVIASISPKGGDETSVYMLFNYFLSIFFIVLFLTFTLTYVIALPATMMTTT